MKRLAPRAALCGFFLTCAALFLQNTATASSHMDAPLITLDDAANTTDVYAFVTERGDDKYLTAAVSVYPFEDPGIGPNRYNFDKSVIYGLHVSLGDDLAAGRKTVSYYFMFNDEIRNRGTILQSYTGVVDNVAAPEQNLVQRYSVWKVDARPGQGFSLLGNGVVPPNNQGRATPHYNTNGGDGVARDGVANASALDRFTRQSIATLQNGYRAFCGQREDGFFADVQAIFDLLSLRDPGKDTQKGFNVHTIVLEIPVDDLGGDMQMAGVHANTLRQEIEVRFDSREPLKLGNYVQVGRQGNPLFCEGFVAEQDKDTYNRTDPTVDATLFRPYALTPELAALLNAIVFQGNPIPGIEQNRADLVGIFIPDLIKVDLSTAAVPLAGGGPNHPTNPDDQGFDRRSVFGGDTVFSPLQNQQIPGGWPNGRRFGDDVVDIGVSAVISDLASNPPVIRTAGDNVDANDAVYSKVLPYAGTPHNGRNHRHD